MSETHLNGYSASFYWLCFSSFLFFMGFNMIIPELPQFLTNLGGASYKGYIIGVFTLVAGLSRPFSGKLCDTIGRVPIMVFGMVVSTVCTVLYPFLGSIWLFFVLRTLHGLSTGFTPTGTSAYASDIIPAHKTGEGLGILSLISTIGMALAPALGSQITIVYGINTLFYACTAVSAASAIAFFFLKETLPTPQPFSLKLLNIKRSEIYEPAVLFPSFILFLMVLTFGVVVTAIPDISVWLGFENKGIFFLVFTVTSIVPRLVAGKASDKHGRRTVAKLGAMLMLVATATAVFATNKTVFLVAAVLYGLSVGIYAPTLPAWVIDKSPKMNKGKAVATMYIALEAGICLGSVGTGFLLNWYPKNPNFSFIIGFLGAMVALFFLFKPTIHIKGKNG